MISRLCHLGLPVSDLDLEMAFFNSLGFINQFEQFIKHDDIYGLILCCMLSVCAAVRRPPATEFACPKVAGYNASGNKSEQKRTPRDRCS